MPWAEQRENGLWRAVWRDERGHKRSKSGIKSEAAAMRYAGEQESKARRGDPTGAGRCPTWDEWSKQWVRLRVVEASTAETDKARIDRYLKPHWGEVRLNRITRTMVQAWVNQLGETFARNPSKKDDVEPRLLSAASVARIYNLFASSMSAAVDAEEIPLSASPCRRIELRPPGEGHERYLTRGEFDAIAFHLNEPYKTAAEVLVRTGMRFGEFAGLHWHRVDLVGGRVDVLETWDPASGTIKPYTKGKRRRWVPIGAKLRKVLEQQIDRIGDPAASCELPHAGTVRCRSGLVVPAPMGGALDDHNFGRRQWADAVALAGVDHVRLHDLRHTYASWLVQDGVSIQEVQRILGHASIVTTMRYAHLGQSQDELVLRALG
jgi:integrase